MPSQARSFKNAIFVVKDQQEGGFWNKNNQFLPFDPETTRIWSDPWDARSARKREFGDSFYSRSFSTGSRMVLRYEAVAIRVNAETREVIGDPNA